MSNKLCCKSNFYMREHVFKVYNLHCWHGTVRLFLNITPVILDQNYIQLKNQVIKAERRVLKELGFSVHIKHPHKIIVMYLQVLNYEKNQQLMQYSWNYMNDSLRTDVFVRYQPETVACACIYLTARKLKLPLPKNPHWFTLFGITENEIRQVCLMILRLYSRPKINVDNLEKKIEELCKKYQDAKVKARGNSGDNTPNNNSPSSPGAQKSSGAHNAWGGFISRSGSHIVPSNEKRSRSKSPSHSPANKHHKRMKKHGRSRSRSPSRNHKKSHKRKTSYSRSRSNSPHKVARKGREKRRSRSISDDKEVRNERYIDRYERHEKIDKYNSRDEKYIKEERERYVEKERYDDKFDRKERHEKTEKRYERGERDDKYREERYKDDRYKEDRHNNRDEKERYRKSKHRDEEKEREREKKDRRR